MNVFLRHTAKEVRGSSEDINKAAEGFVAASRNILDVIRKKDKRQMMSIATKISEAVNPIEAIFRWSGYDGPLDFQNLHPRYVANAFDSALQASDAPTFAAQQQQWPDIISHIQQEVTSGRGLIIGLDSMIDQGLHAGDAADGINDGKAFATMRGLFTFMLGFNKPEELLSDFFGIGTREDFDAAFAATDGTITRTQFACGFLVGHPVMEFADLAPMKRKMTIHLTAFITKLLMI